MTVRRIAIGCSIFMLAGCAIIAVIAYLNRATLSAASEVITLAAEQPYADPLTTPDEVLDFVESQGENVGLVAYSVNEDGTPIEDGTEIYHNADEAYPLASTIKIVVLAAYAREVAAGTLDPTTPVPLVDWERYYIPGTDGGAHSAALLAYNIGIDDKGFAADDTQTVPLDKIAEAMITVSDNAAADYLMNLVGREKLEETIADAELTGQQTPFPISGFMLLWQTHDNPTFTTERAEEIAALAPEDLTEQAWAMNAQLQDDAWLTEEQAFRRGSPNANIRGQLIAVRAFPSGTPRDYASIMARLVTNTFISPEVSALMRPHLEWPMAIGNNSEQFETLGTKGGSLGGILTDAVYYVPKTGDYAGQPRVVVLFMRQSPFAAWLTFTQNFAQQGFELEVATNRTFAEQVRTRLE